MQASFGYSLDSASLFRNSGGSKGGGGGDGAGGGTGERVAAIAATAFVGAAVLVACVAVFLVWRRYGLKCDYSEMRTVAHLLSVSRNTPVSHYRVGP